ncbi:aminotransferase class V-fold PLP-dependent enzyme [Fuerstiella marisgermanici]|uniref:Isopenicillin N epimerase n=1 Tax=Fuerstiella marisgermanici TaxID=1891926 RepID=A0A1P8WPW3_9PLAN|nr:aminotransferase class V-fold PLP-dependent enzyme [Fuerstiella marisgermanici]APZ96093.1 Isopenicillin N epimerase [Fuerstiella marisgermanici]
MPHADHWNLDPSTTYLNHGSFGPSPIAVRKAREEWSARLERQPMRFFCQDMEAELHVAAEHLAKFLHTKAARLALVDNATVAMNIVAESVDLKPGDEVLLTDHEYGAVRNIWNHKSQQTGAKIITAQLPFPLDDEGIVTALENAISDNTKMIVISHVTSPTAAILPVKAICQLAKRYGILTAIDGPHAIAMLDVHLDDIGCDYYCASCHKWLCAPFGSGFLWAHPKHHGKIRCPITSWGGSIAGRPSCWQDRINWLGTRDPAPLLSIPAAIEFFSELGLDTFRQHAHKLICHARRELLAMDGIGPFCTSTEADVVSMCAVELPQPADWKPGYHGHPDPLQLELRDEHGIELPVAAWNGRRFLRVSAHLYNSQEDIDKLLNAVNQSRHLR